MHNFLQKEKQCLTCFVSFLYSFVSSAISSAVSRARFSRPSSMGSSQLMMLMAKFNLFKTETIWHAVYVGERGGGRTAGFYLNAWLHPFFSPRYCGVGFLCGKKERIKANSRCLSEIRKKVAFYFTAGFPLPSLLLFPLRPSHRLFFFQCTSAAASYF